MAGLVDNNGGTVTDNLAKAELMNDYFSSVFTVEDTNNLPVLGDKAEGHRLENINISQEIQS